MESKDSNSSRHITRRGAVPLEKDRMQISTKCRNLTEGSEKDCAKEVAYSDLDVCFRTMRRVFPYHP